MLAPTDIIGLNKSAQSLLDGTGMIGSTPTLGDLVAAIKADRGLTPVEEQQLLTQLQTRIGAMPLSTPISSLMFGGLGGILGAVISKYFGLGPVAQTISAAAGFGLGRSLYSKLNAPPDPYKGYTMIGGHW